MKKLTFYIITLLIVNDIAAQNVGIGTSTPTRAKLELHGGLVTSAIFGGESTGISLQKNYPGIGFNTYYSGGNKAIAAGYGVRQFVETSTGNFFLYTLANANTDESQGSGNRVLTILQNGRCGIGGAANPGSELQLPNVLGHRKLTLWETTDNNYQYYGFGVLPGQLVYNVPSSQQVHRFFAGADASSASTLMTIGGNRMVSIGDGNASGDRLGINLLTSPVTNLHVNGGVALTRAMYNVTNAQAHVNVGNNSYIHIHAAEAGTPTVTLSNGLVTGHLLIIEASISYNFEILDTGNCNLAANRTMTGSDTLTLMWSGSRWIEVSFSAN